jgi:hypothetical protein
MPWLRQCWPLATEAWFQSQANTFGIYGGKSGTGTGFSFSALDFACQYDSGDTQAFVNVTDTI